MCLLEGMGPLHASGHNCQQHPVPAAVYFAAVSGQRAPEPLELPVSQRSRDRQPAAGQEHTAHFLQGEEAFIMPQMLQHEAACSEVAATIGKRQCKQIALPSFDLRQRAGQQGKHRRGDVDSDQAGSAGGEKPRQIAGSAAEIGAGFSWQRVEPISQLFKRRSIPL